MFAQNTSRIPAVKSSLLNFLDDLKSDLDKGVGGQPPPLLAPQLHALIETYHAVAEEYFECASELISQYAPLDPELQEEFHYGEVLKQIANHVHLLAHLVEQVRLNSDSNALIQSLIGSIASRFPTQPLLIPLLATEFKYIHLNYVQDVGIVGFPPSVWLKPETKFESINWWEWPHFWHEVAGFWVARQRRQPTGGTPGLAALAMNLQAALCNQPLRNGPPGANLWTYYRQFYQASALTSLPVKLNLTAQACRLEPQKSRRLRSYFLLGDAAVAPAESKNVDTDLVWQMDWLGEFIEDLFGIEALGESMFRPMTEAFLGSYQRPEIGDLHHPSLLLRLRVAYEFLNLAPQQTEAKTAALHAVEAYLSTKSPSKRELLGFGTDAAANEALARTAQEIAQWYIRECRPLFLPNQAPAKADWRQLGSDELNITQPVRQIIDGLESSTNGKSLDELQRAIQASYPTYEPTMRGWKIKASDVWWLVEDSAGKIRPFSDIREHLDPGLTEPEQAAALLTALHSVSFADIDPGGPEPVPPYPPVGIAKP